MRTVQHDRENDLCDSSPFEGCICHLPTDEQWRRVSGAVRSSLEHPITLHATFSPAVDDPEELRLFED